MFTKNAYDRGLVIIQCPSCKHRHLIADHLGWFKDTAGTSEGRHRTVEDFMHSKGEHVRRGAVNEDGSVVEYVDDDNRKEKS